MKLSDPDVKSTIQDFVNTLFCIIALSSSVLFFASRVDAETVIPASYSLTGTIISKAFIGAVINDAKGEQSFYRLYEKLPDGMKIVEVRSNSITLKGESGARYDIYIDHNIKTVGAASQSAHIASSSPGTAISTAAPLQPNPRRGIRRRNTSSEED